MEKKTSILSSMLAILIAGATLLGCYYSDGVSATETIETIDLTALDESVTNDKWAYDSETGVVTINSGEVRITSNSETINDKTIVISGDSSVCPEVSVILDDLVMDFTGIKKTPIIISESSTSDVSLYISGDNFIRSGRYNAIYKMSKNLSQLMIDGDGFIELYGNGDSGIGSSNLRLNLIINGGTIVAHGGTGAPGIGNKSAFDNITINGGDITAYGGSNASGIGCGNYVTAECRNIVINGGIIHAYGGDGNSRPGAGIGGYGTGYIVINGGLVYAYGGVNTSNDSIIGAGIGSSGYSETKYITINITGGSVYTSTIFDNDYVKVTGGSVNFSENTPAIYNNDGDEVSLLVLDGFTPNEPVDYDAILIDAEYYSLRDVVADSEGNIYVYLPEGTEINEDSFITEVSDDSDEVIDISLLSYDVSGNGWNYESSTNVLTITSGNVRITSRGGLVDGKQIVVLGNKNISPEINITFDNLIMNNDSSSPFDILSNNNSNVNITLIGISTFTAKGTAINKEDGNLSTLTIGGNGVLNAISSGWGAGIGTRNDILNLVINSGTINAYGSKGGAGIGGHSSAGSNIIINGGNITAIGGNAGAGIGGGNSSFKSVSIVINGGTIYARGGDSLYDSANGIVYNAGSGIGCGINTATLSNITINGGDIVAIGGNATEGRSGAGIGGGTVKTIVIFGGNITAIAGENYADPTVTAAGIGSSANCRVSTIAIISGTIDASSPAGSAIGCGTGGSLTSACPITGGTITTHGEASFAGFYIDGGSINNEGASLSALNGSSFPLETCVLDGFTPNEPVYPNQLDIQISSYGLNGVVADSEGKVYLCLPVFDDSYPDVNMVTYFDGSSILARQIVFQGTLSTEPSLDFGDREFVGWFYDTQFLAEYEFGMTICDSLDVYAEFSDSVAADSHEVHVYPYICSTTCLLCEETREAIDHTYTNDCDAECDVCGELRIPGEHVYDNDCDTTCNICDEEREVNEHVYDYDCDSVCNICGFERVAADHTYDYDCDATCNVCGEERTPGEHVYDNDCDVDCNACGEVRIPFDHVYDFECDAICNVCGFVRTASEHVYDGPYDLQCNICGESREGWVLQDGYWYYADAEGNFMTGWLFDDGKWYYFEPETGKMLDGWQWIDGNWYYFISTGSMATNWKKIGETWYYFDASGHMAVGWRQINGEWYYFLSSGKMVANAWNRVDGKWYYFRANGVMAVGWAKIDDVWYYLKPSGDMAVGWAKIDGEWYYFRNNGTMATYWVNIDGNYYYFGYKGAMFSNTWIDNYHVNASGVWDQSR